MPRPGSSTARGYGAAWRRVRVAVLERDDRRCHWCGAEATTVDHLHALAAGGDALDPANLAASCGPCNYRRGAALAADRRRRGPGGRLAPGGGWSAT